MDFRLLIVQVTVINQNYLAGEMYLPHLNFKMFDLPFEI